MRLTRQVAHRLALRLAQEFGSVVPEIYFVDLDVFDKSDKSEDHVFIVNCEPLDEENILTYYEHTTPNRGRAGRYRV